MSTAHLSFDVVWRTGRRTRGEVKRLALPLDLLVGAWTEDASDQQAVIDYVELALGPERDRRKRVRWSQLSIKPG